MFRQFLVPTVPTGTGSHSKMLLPLKSSMSSYVGAETLFEIKSQPDVVQQLSRENRGRRRAAAGKRRAGAQGPAGVWVIRLDVAACLTRLVGI